MTPFLDEIGIMWLKGRFQHANLLTTRNIFFYLDAKHDAIQLLLEHEHRENLHEQTEYVRSVVWQKS